MYLKGNLVQRSLKDLLNLELAWHKAGKIQYLKGKKKIKVPPNYETLLTVDVKTKIAKAGSHHCSQARENYYANLYQVTSKDIQRRIKCLLTIKVGEKDLEFILMNSRLI